MRATAVSRSRDRNRSADRRENRSLVNRALTFQRQPIVDGVDLHSAVAPWFQTVAIRLRFIEPIGDDAAARSLILGLLRRGCRSSPDLMSLARRLESLYGAAIAFDSERIGNLQTSDFTLRVIRPDRVRGTENLLSEGLATLDELIREPVVENEGFRRTEFEQERTNLERSIRALLDDKAAFAQRRFLSLTFPGEPYGQPEIGSLDDLPGLDPVDLLSRHRERIGSANLRLFATGDLTGANIDELLAMGRSFGERSPRSPPPIGQREIAPSRQVEEIASGESHLFLGYRFAPSTLDPVTALSHSVAACVLGGGAHSLLFREIRERLRLAYSTHAHLDRPKGLISIYAGIRSDTVELAESKLREQLKRVATGDFDGATLDAARESLEHSLRTALDSPLRAIDFAARALATGFPPDPSAYASALARVARENVVEAASTWREDVTYFAVGSCDDRDLEPTR